MTRKIDGANCTNVEWVGRAHCSECHIRQVMLFSQLPDTAFENTIQPIDNYLYPPGSVLYEAGTQKKFIYSIRRGMVKLVHEAKDGSSRIVRLLGPGTAVGLELLDGSDSYHHTAIAVSQVDLCKIPVTIVKHLSDEYPTLVRQVGQRLQDQLDLADEWIISLGTGAAKQRVAQLLLMLGNHYANEKGAFILLNREDMAAMTGISVETVSRMIAEYKRQNILYKANDNFYMCDIAALHEITKNC